MLLSGISTVLLTAHRLFGDFEIKEQPAGKHTTARALLRHDVFKVWDLAGFFGGGFSKW